MFRPALKLIVRLLPFAAAMMASVAIGASTQAPDAGAPGARQWQPLVAAQSVRRTDGLTGTTDSIDLPLLARADSSDLLTNAYPVGSLDAALTAPVAKPVARSDGRHGFELPRPDRWTSLLATLALGAFFFLRRIV